MVKMFMDGIQHSRETSLNIDCPVQANLKRSSSAPMINQISSCIPSDSILQSTRITASTCSSVPRTRRFSSSLSSNPMGSGLKLTPRVKQLRQEECIDSVSVREAAHEKEIHSTLQISQSWEDLTFETDSLSFRDPSEELSTTVLSKTPLTLSQLQPGTDSSSGRSSNCASPSPTRLILNQPHCYSPKFHMGRWKNSSLSPSPTRKAFATRRSLSPISIRPSCLGNSTSAVKRKFELDESTGSDCLLHPPLKRLSNLLMPNLSIDK